MTKVTTVLLGKYLAGNFRPDLTAAHSAAVGDVVGRIRFLNSVGKTTKIDLGAAAAAVDAVVGNSSNFDFLECRRREREKY